LNGIVRFNRWVGTSSFESINVRHICKVDKLSTTKTQSTTTKPTISTTGLFTQSTSSSSRLTSILTHGLAKVSSSTALILATETQSTTTKPTISTSGITTQRTSTSVHPTSIPNVNMYVTSEYGSSNCPQNSSPITNKDSCEVAAKIVKNNLFETVQTIQYSVVPFYCLQNKWGTVRFNTVKGASHSNFRRICKVGKYREI
jgi:hypothetical protein